MFTIIYYSKYEKAPTFIKRPKEMQKIQQRKSRTG